MELCIQKFKYKMSLHLRSGAEDPNGNVHFVKIKNQKISLDKFD